MSERSSIIDHRSSILLCPGQGAQQVGMGAGYEAALRRASERVGFDLVKLCQEGPVEELNRTDRAQVALYVVGVASYEAVRERLGEPVAMAGLSLGEFTALHLAGAFSYEDGLQLVKLRGEAMQAAATAAPSTMVAMTGEIDEAKIVQLCEQAAEGDVLVPANFNSPMQVVVSGSVPACERAAKLAESFGLRATPLAVAGAFHSPFMQPAAQRLAAALAQTPMHAPRVPVISNVTAQPHTGDVDRIKRRLVEQLTQPVRWSQSMQFAAATYRAGCVELAPGKVLAGLMRRIDKTVKVTAVGDL